MCVCGVRSLVGRASIRIESIYQSNRMDLKSARTSMTASRPRPRPIHCLGRARGVACGGLPADVLLACAARLSSSVSRPLSSSAISQSSGEAVVNNIQLTNLIDRVMYYNAWSVEPIDRRRQAVQISIEAGVCIPAVGVPVPADETEFGERGGHQRWLACSYETISRGIEIDRNQSIHGLQKQAIKGCRRLG